MNITAESISRVITKNSRAIMVVHFAGLPVNIEPILDFGLPVIEDAAHAPYSKINNKACGSIGEIGIYSFDAVKNLAVGEGGGITTKDQVSAERARALRYCGIKKSGFENVATGKSVNWWEYELSEPFIKMLPTNISASIGLAQLRRRNELQEKRKQFWDLYQVGLREVGDISLPLEARKNEIHSYFTYVIRTGRRTELANYLLGEGIYTTLRYHALNNYKDYGQLGIELPATEIIEDTALSIPLHPRLTESEIEYIIDKIKNFF